MRLSMLCAIAAMGCGLAAAAPFDAQWAAEPPDEALAAGLPPGTLRDEAPGQAVIRCKVGDDGRLAGCAVIRDTPAGAGYGAALLSLAPKFLMKPAADGGAQPGSEVVIPWGRSWSDTSPGWVRKPTAASLMAVWPAEAMKRGLGGKATVNCMISAQGALYDCVVLSETPPGLNFGAAAIAITPQLLMKPAMRRGQPVLSAANIPINFEGGPRRDPSAFGAVAAVSATMAWPAAPTYADVRDAYPRRARESRVGGRATLACIFSAEGRLHDCDTLGEEPRSQGFAEAALRLASKFRGPGKLPDGKSINHAIIQIAVAFDPSMLTDAEPTIGKPLWAGLPSPEQTDGAFGALAKGLAGTARARLACVVQQGGGVSDCKSELETPPDLGVGAAALTLAPHFILSTWSAEGLPIVGGVVHIPLRVEGVRPPAPAKP